jgi:Double zinc ribbon
MVEDDRVLESFHAVLVEEIRAQRPEYLTGPFTVAEIYQNLVPYGSHRDRIGVEMNGDYEDALLRLLAGEGGYLVLESDAALRNIREELESTNPNTGLYREYAAVDVRLGEGASGGEPEEWADEPEAGDVEEDDFGFGSAEPSEDSHGSAEAADEAAVSVDDLAPMADEAGETGGEDDGPSACKWCRAELPTRDGLNFCPFCGTDTRFVPCAACGAELEPGWCFCVACGEEV